VRYTSASKTDHLYTEISADNNIYVNDKRNCILRKTRAIKVCSARIAADISGRSYALCRYSKTKSLPNPQRVRVYCYIKILRWNENTMYRKLVRRACLRFRELPLKFYFYRISPFASRRFSILWRKRYIYIYIYIYSNVIFFLIFFVSIFYINYLFY